MAGAFPCAPPVIGLSDRMDEDLRCSSLICGRLPHCGRTKKSCQCDRGCSARLRTAERVETVITIDNIPAFPDFKAMLTTALNELVYSN